jgi:hypothetical protein
MQKIVACSVMKPYWTTSEIYKGALATNLVMEFGLDLRKTHQILLNQLARQT